MEIIKGYKKISRKFKNPVLTLGNFDGVHLGHQMIFKRVKEKAAEIEGESILYTFDPHPMTIFRPQTPLLYIIPLNRKMELLEKMGIDVVICEEFTKDFSQIEAESFVNQILCGIIGVKSIVVGPDCGFGKDRKGNVDLLKKIGAERNFMVEVVNPTKKGETIISSSLIRELIQRGKVKEASASLGRKHLIEGLVIKEERGDKDLFVWLTCKGELYPREGIYLVEVYLGEKSREGIATISEDLPVKIQIQNFTGDISGKRIRLAFLDKL